MSLLCSNVFKYSSSLFSKCLSFGFFRLFIILFYFTFLNTPTHAQNHNGEVWAGYINSVQLKENWHFWNDYHVVPQSFALYRLGLTYETKAGFRITNGYAYVWTSSPNSTALNRGEHRYWGQVIKNFKLANRLRFNTRFRYDLRFREALDANGDVMDRNYLLNYRWRISNNLRYKLTDPSDGKFFHVDIMNETLYNTGKYLNNGFDQIRNYFLFGYTNPKITILAGYSNRFFPNANGPWRMNHGFTVWLTHRVRWTGFKQDDDVL